MDGDIGTVRRKVSLALRAGETNQVMELFYNAVDAVGPVLSCFFKKVPQDFPSLLGNI